jgi:hypothetical protein
MATDLAQATSSPATVGKDIALGHQDWAHWADTLSRSLPAGAAQKLVSGMKTGQLEEVRAGLGAKQQAAVEYGVGAVVGGVTRFVFGREVVEAAQQAFAEAPAEFPPHLEITTAEGSEDDGEPNAALMALQGAARSAGSWLGDSANAIGSGVGTVTGSVTRPFRSVDVDGDGIPDEPQALTAVKGVGGAISGAAGRFASPFKRKKGEETRPQLTGEQE